MNATIYWTSKRIQHAIHEARFSAKLWWLKQQVEFLEWNQQWEGLLSSSMFGPRLQAIRQEDHHGISPLSVLHR
jgi:hypothetical protein